MTLPEVLTASGPFLWTTFMSSLNLARVSFNFFNSSTAVLSKDTVVATVGSTSSSVRAARFFLVGFVGLRRRFLGPEAAFAAALQTASNCLFAAALFSACLPFFFFCLFEELSEKLLRSNGVFFPLDFTPNLVPRGQFFLPAVLSRFTPHRVTGFG